MGNEINSLHPISDDLISGLVLQGSLGEVLHVELILFCFHTLVTSSLPPAFSVLSSPSW